jgi:nitrate/nitrite transporter NarK
MVFASFGAILCVAVGTFGPTPGVCSAGIRFVLLHCISTLPATVSELHQENYRHFLGLLFTFSGLGGMLGPWLIGGAQRWTSDSHRICMITLFCMIVCITLFWLMKQPTLAKTR